MTYYMLNADNRNTVVRSEASLEEMEAIYRDRLVGMCAVHSKPLEPGTIETAVEVTPSGTFMDDQAALLEWCRTVQIECSKSTPSVSLGSLFPVTTQPYTLIPFEVSSQPDDPTYLTHWQELAKQCGAPPTPEPTSECRIKPDPAKEAFEVQTPEEVGVADEAFFSRLRSMSFGRSKPTTVGGFTAPLHIGVFLNKAVEHNRKLWNDLVGEGTSMAYNDEELLNMMPHVLESLNQPPSKVGDTTPPDAPKKLTRTVRKHIIAELDKWWTAMCRHHINIDKFDVERTCFIEKQYLSYRKYFKKTLPRIITTEDTIDDIRIDTADLYTFSVLGKDDSGEWIRPISLTYNTKGHFELFEDTI